jgi:hypothetical protein
MAISLTVINEVGNGRGTVSIDFVYDILASSAIPYPVSSENEYYFKVSTASKQAVSGSSIPIQTIKSLDELALDGTGTPSQSRGIIANPNAYASITDMVEDYLYDFIHGHTADQFSSGVSAQGAMDI